MLDNEPPILQSLQSFQSSSTSSPGIRGFYILCWGSDPKITQFEENSMSPVTFLSSLGCPLAALGPHLGAPWGTLWHLFCALWAPLGHKVQVWTNGPKNESKGGSGHTRLHSFGGYDVIKGERVRLKGYLEDFALSKNEADELIMSARNKIYKDREIKSI